MLFWLQGFTLGAALILPLGPQNTLVLNQGILRQHALTAATFCTLSDMLLIGAGIFGGSALLQHSTLAMQLITWAGVLFLLWYGWGTLRQVFTPLSATEEEIAPSRQRLRLLLTLMAVTWLNPHVYLDTFVVLGSLGSQVPPEQRLWFAAGAMSASLLWFYALALLAGGLSHWLRRPRARQAIHLLVAIMMFWLAFHLLADGLRMLHR